jgi:uncharacterized PurR-regulated membrane protein YhhQ (DUF165 family)
MITDIIKDKGSRLFIILGGFFVANALIAEVIGVKIFSFEKTLGLSPFNIRIFGNDLSLNLTAGVLLWPVVFVMTDLVNEYYGMKGVRFLSWLTAGLIAFAFSSSFIASSYLCCFKHTFDIKFKAGIKQLSIFKTLFK